MHLSKIELNNKFECKNQF